MKRLAGLSMVLFLAGCSSGTGVEPLPFIGFEGDLIVLVDTDMPAFAYANGVLTPRVKEPDAAHLVYGGAAPALSQGLAASNTVTTWPNSVGVSSDGRFALVIEGRKHAPAGVDRVDDVQSALAPGDHLTLLSRGAAGEWSRQGQFPTAPGPTAIALSSDDSHFVVSSASQTSDLQFFQLVDGIPVPQVAVDLPFSNGVGRDAGLITALAWHPFEDVLAVNMGGAAVGFVRVGMDPDGAVASAALIGAPIIFGDLLSVVRWSPDGRFVYALDTGWGARASDRVLNGPGSIFVLAWNAANGARFAGSAPSGTSSENFAISRDGALIATLNMERTYLPGGFPLGLVRGRDASSISLLAVDPDTGLPSAIGERLPFRGVLPQGIAFDRTGKSLAVTVFQDHDPNSTAGWIEYFRIEGEGDAARLRPTGHRIETPRGAHDLALAP